MIPSLAFLFFSVYHFEKALQKAISSLSLLNQRSVKGVQFGQISVSI
jgi:hypothetical protein